MATIRQAVLILVAGVLSIPATLAIDVDLVAITAGSNRDDDVLVDYFLSFELEGFDIISAEVFKDGFPRTLVCTMVQEGPESWNCDLLGFSSLNDICNNVGFGDFVIELEDSGGGTDELTVFFDPGCADPFTGYPDITTPLPGASTPPNTDDDDFCWNCSALGACGDNDYVFSIFSADQDLAVGPVLDTFVPRCFDPAICIPNGNGYEYEMSALELYAFFEPSFTQMGDLFEYVSAFEAQNSTLFNVTDPTPTTPPAVPDGDGVTDAVEVEKFDSAGSTMDIFYDEISCCGVTNHHLLYGFRADLPSAVGAAFGVAGSECSIGANGLFTWFGSPAVAPDDMLWFLVVGDDGTDEGSWGQDSALNERLGSGAGGVSGECSLTSLDLANVCGR